MVGHNLKQTQGASPNVKVFQCPQCGSGILIRAVGRSISAVCQSCQTLVDVSDENLKIISASFNKMKVLPDIPIGQKGKIRGELWEVIGFMQRCDGTGIYSWREYLLSNPFKGFRWLTEFDGHWNYVLTTKQKPQVSAHQQMEILGKNYRLFHKGEARVQFVLGEFYWRVQEGERVQVEDYISPPEILSKEESGGEVIWSIGEYIEPEDVRRGFQLSAPLPVKFGIAPNQPSNRSLDPSKLFRCSTVFAIAILLIQLLKVFTSSSEVVISENGVVQSQNEQLRVTPQFEVVKPTDSVQIVFSSPVSNSWLELSGSLVNENGGNPIEFEQGVEYYSGSDSDGYWTEGSGTSSVELASIPQGIYKITYKVAGPLNMSNQTFNIVVKRGVVLWSDFLFSLFAILVFPFVLWFRHRSFEKQRWSSSDYSPYWSLGE